MIQWSAAEVTSIITSRPGIQELEVRMENSAKEQAILYTDEHGEASVGDIVLLNTTAVRLGLGTGGYHFVHAVLQEAFKTEQCPAADGHLMKLRYTSLQRSVLTAEEDSSPYHALFQRKQSLNGLPVLIGELHSMLPVALSWLRYRMEESNGDSKRFAYMMTDGGALPIAFSRHVAQLKQLDWLAGTITYGHAYGGDVETLNKFSGLIAAKHIMHADAAIITMGPGIAGTGTLYGHSGMEVGEIANAVRLLGGVPIIIPRISFAEQRERHYGLSHHVFSALSVCLKEAWLPLPKQLPGDQLYYVQSQIASMDSSSCRIEWIEELTIEQAERALMRYPLRITTMGRDWAADPAFFLGVCAAAEAAWRLLTVR